MSRPSESAFRRAYRRRVMACLATSLAVLVAAVRLWPVPDPAADEAPTFHTHAREVIQIEAVQQTSQSQEKPPPPAPAPPVVVPDDGVREEDQRDRDVPPAGYLSAGCPPP